MQKHLLYINLFAISSALALSACADEVENAITPDMPEVGEKTPIELSVGGVDAPALTRAVITDGVGKTMQAFDVNTKIFMVMKSEKDPATHNGYEYSGDRTSPLYTVTRGEVAANSTDVIFYDNAETKTGNRVRYWDDAHARSSQLTIWAYAQKGESTWNDCYFQEIINSEKSKLDDAYTKKFSTGTYYSWQSTEIYPAIREWNAMLGTETAQTERTLRCQDLLFSNNLSYNTEKSWVDYRLKFDFTAHKFPRVDDVIEGTSTKKTEMKFYHAMSKITIQIKAGDGYKADGTDFILANSKSIDKLSGFNTKGLFNIKDGEFQMIHARTEITSIPKISEKNGKTDPNYVLEALAIPNIYQFLKSYPEQSDEGSRFVENGTNVMIQFTIDGNTYKITSGALYDALKELPVGAGTNQIQKYTDNGNYIPMEAGKNYVFTFTIGKQRINNISANLADWINVTAVEQTPSNAYVKVTVKTDEGNYDNPVKGDPTFDLYRAAGALYTGAATEEGYNGYKDYTWEKGYEKSTSLAETAENTGIYTTEWFWPNNQTYYHFRTLSPQSTAVTAGTAENGGNDYVSIAGGTLITVGEVAPTAKDYIWGAPFKTETANPDAYSFETGFCANADKADGNLYWAIGSTKDNITLIQHHMTSQVFVDLETSTGADAVNLTNATIDLVNIATTAKLNMGNGLITSFGDIRNVRMTPDVAAAVTTGDNQHPAYDYSYGVVAQPLSKGESKIGVKITAADGNVYLINDLSAINEKSTTTAITEWLPGKKYYYKFVLKKTGIDKITATVVDWENVTADDETVVIQ